MVVLNLPSRYRARTHKRIISYRKALNAIHAGACGRVVITDQMRAMVSAKGKKAGLPEPPLPGAETGSETWKAWLIDVARISQVWHSA